jgi:hypothetical protein
MATNRPDSVITLTGFPPLVPHVPPNWPTRPQPGKLSLLWQFNFHDLYHKNSPFTRGDDIFGVIPNKQPFIYTYIDEVGNPILDQLPTQFKTLAAEFNITNDTLTDVVRVGKYEASPQGILFNIRQIALQRLNSFDETRIFNPLSPILATIQPLTLGFGENPTRHIEGGLPGLLNSVTSIIGINNQKGYQTPDSTAGSDALPNSNSGQGKGLIRGSDASKALAKFQSSWQISPSPAAGGVSGLFSMIQNAATQLFGNPRQPTGTLFRADESAYTLMALSRKVNAIQSWFPSPQTSINGVKKTTNITTTSTGPSSFIRQKLIALPNGPVIVNISTNFIGQSIKGRPTGYFINDGDLYSNDVGSPVFPDDLTNSDILVQFSFYVDPSNKFSTKFTDPLSDKVEAVSNNLKKVLNGINGPQSVYTATTNTYSKLLASGDVKSIGYDNLFGNIPSQDSPLTTYGTIQEYANGSNRNPASLDQRVRFSKNLRFATTFNSDGINQLDILDKNRTIKPEDNLTKLYPNWKEYKPYEDDLIAFFFYDVVNQKYIPFRATLKGISEGNTAYWNDLRFIGRADQLYSYNGFSRTLGFTFNVVINSITELLPSWKRINYIASAVKPSNYTRSERVENNFNRFMVAPMFMITIGDLYTYQPVVITNVNVNIPDDASWETLNQYNSDEWSYLNGIIKNNTLAKRYGQLPREVEIAITCNLLEKERAQVGGSHFGHAPRVDNWENQTGDNVFLVGDNTIPYLPAPSELHKDFIELNPASQPAK